MKVLGAQGTTFATARFVLGERLSVANFARALDIDDPLFQSTRHARDAGYAGRPVSAPMYAFFQTVSNADLEERLGFTWGKTLGAGMEFEAGAIAGEEDEVTGQSTVEDAWEKTSDNGVTRQFLRLRTDFWRDDDIVCRWRALFIERKDGMSDDGTPSAPSEPDDVAPVGPAPDLGVPPIATIGQSLPSHRMGTVDRLRLARISIAIDNPDTLHIDDEVAQASGFPTVVGQGSAATGLMYEPVRRWAGLPRIRAGAVRLLAPYSLGAELSASGQVAAIDEADGGQVAICQVRLTDQADAGIATAQFQVLL